MADNTITLLLLATYRLENLSRMLPFVLLVLIFRQQQIRVFDTMLLACLCTKWTNSNSPHFYKRLKVLYHPLHKLGFVITNI